jgi:hypothetical protein
MVPASPSSTNSRETFTQAGLDPTSRSRPISVNEFSTTDAVAPSLSYTTAEVASLPRNSSSYPATWSWRLKMGCRATKTSGMRGIPLCLIDALAAEPEPKRTDADRRP